MQNGFEQYARKSRRELFLEEMEGIIPWARLTGLSNRITRRGRTAVRRWAWSGCCASTLCNSGSTCRTRAWKKLCMSSLVLRRFAGIDLGKEPAPDETTICKFRHLLEEHDLGQAIFAEVNAHLAANGVKVARGTIVDATIIHAPSSTKNATGTRDPEMHQVRKGKQWYFGMKAHVGVDSKSGTVHTAVATAANRSDSRVLPELLHGEERKVWGDGGYQGQGEVIREVAPMAQDMTCRRTKFKHGVDALQRSKNRTKSRVRAKVEHVFRVMKRQFGFDRVRYRGLKKNANQMFACFALVNLYIVRKRLVPAAE